jgi:hypothetical protein
MNLLKKALFLTLMVIIGSVAFVSFNFAWDYSSRDSTESLSLKVCPANSLEAVADYYLEVAGLLAQASGVYNNPLVSDAEAAQVFNSLYLQAEELSHPECASLHNEVVSLAFRYESYAKSASAEGGWFNDLRAQYYHTVSVDYMYLVPFITHAIVPELNPNEGYILNT